MSTSPQILRAELKKRQDVVRARLKEILAARRWSQAHLSTRAGLAKGTVYNFLLGNKRIGMMSLRSVAEALQVSEEYLLDLTPNPVREAGSTHSDDVEESAPKSVQENLPIEPLKQQKNVAQQAIENLFVMLPLPERIETIHALFRMSQQSLNDPN